MAESHSTADVDESAVTLSAQTYRVLNHVPFDWTDEHAVRLAAKEATGFPVPSIAQRLIALERKGLVAIRWNAFVRQIRRVQLEPLS